MRSVPLLVLFASLVAAGCDSGSQGPPRSARILEVAVTDAPLVDPSNGQDWDGDIGGGPEVYFRLFDADVDVVADPGADRLNPRDDAEVFAVDSAEPWYEDVRDSTFPLFWDVEPGYVVRDLEDELVVALFDYDPFGDDDPMAVSEVFRMGDVAPSQVDGRVDTITLRGVDLDGRDADVGVRLTVLFDD